MSAGLAGIAERAAAQSAVAADAYDGAGRTEGALTQPVLMARAPLAGGAVRLTATFDLEALTLRPAFPASRAAPADTHRDVPNAMPGRMHEAAVPVPRTPLELSASLARVHSPEDVLGAGSISTRRAWPRAGRAARGGRAVRPGEDGARVGAGLDAQGAYVWGVEFAGSAVYASDMLGGLWKLGAVSR